MAKAVETVEYPTQESPTLPQPISPIVRNICANIGANGLECHIIAYYINVAKKLDEKRHLLNNLDDDTAFRILLLHFRANDGSQKMWNQVFEASSGRKLIPDWRCTRDNEVWDEILPPLYKFIKKFREEFSNPEYSHEGKLPEKDQIPSGFWD